MVCIDLWHSISEEPRKDVSILVETHNDKSINEESHKAEALVRCNKKGWGSDYFKYITIEPLYTEAE